MKASNRAICLVRVSQRDDDSGQSPEVQRNALFKMADLQEWSLAEGDVLDENIDNGKVRAKSGGAELADRPKMEWAIQEIEARRAKILAAENFDRLFRSVEVQGQVIRRVEKAGGEVWERVGRISYRRAAEKAHAQMKGTFAEYVKDTAMERSRDAIQLMIDRGVVPWKSTPRGYLRDAEGHFSPDPKLAPVIKGAFQLRAEGATIDEVRAHLRENGIEVSYRVTQNLLANPVYVGQIVYGNYQPNPKAHDAIVALAVFDRAQEVRQPRGRPGKSDRLLARLGVLVCASCGGRMVVGHSRARKEGQDGWAMYKCPRRAYGDCDHRAAISAPKVEEMVVEAVKAAIKDRKGRASQKDNRREIEAKLAKARANRTAYLALPLDFTEPTTAAKTVELNDAVGTLEEQLGGLPPSATKLVTGKNWDLFTLDEKREAIQIYVRNVTVARGRGADRVTIEMVWE